MAQWAQLQPQLDLPFFLSFTSLRMMSTTMRSNTVEIRIVPIFSVIHANISPTPFCYVYGLSGFANYTFTLVVSLVASL